MPTFERCPKSVNRLADEILAKYESHAPLKNSGATIDFVFARADTDDNGKLLNDALTKNGVKALGIARKLPLKDRAMGRADAEISLDADWWDDASDEERAALLDHELHHLVPKEDKRGFVTDDLGHQVLKIRPHDFEFGWFRCIAQRHGKASIECRQAKTMMDSSGQLFWPDVVKAVDKILARKTETQPIGAWENSQP